MLNFFASNEENYVGVQKTIFYLVKWGYDYWDLKNMPISEFQLIVKFYNDEIKRKNEAYKKGSLDLEE